MARPLTDMTRPQPVPRPAPVSVTEGREAARRAPRLLFLVTEDWYFCSHRLPLARAARDCGYEVYVATRLEEREAELRTEGFQLIPIRMRRDRINPWHEPAAIAELRRIYTAVRPDIVHQVGLKPVIYGSIAAWLTGVPAVVNALGGLGYVFASQDQCARLLRPLVKLALRWLSNRQNTRLILQTPADRETVEQLGVRSERIALIRGAGVDLSAYSPIPEPAGMPNVVLASRLLWDKGIGEFVGAARLLRQQAVKARFILIGSPDPCNPSSIPISQLEQWQREGDIEWWGYRNDMPDVFAQAHLVCLPTTYGEGVPKVLIEAAACGRAIVASDVPGCREIVLDGDNGLLVPPRDREALAWALRRLIDQPELRRHMGLRGRALAQADFSQEQVVAATFDIYRSLLV